MLLSQVQSSWKVCHSHHNHHLQPPHLPGEVGPQRSKELMIHHISLGQAAEA